MTFDPAMPPVVQLESKWALEYGMPSTHAMVGLSVPFSILVFTYGRYQVRLGNTGIS
jgi:sphingosine-1-phosphate phosphatase 1